MNNSLESSKFFPYIAWTVVVGFAAFTFMLTMHVRDELNTINSNIEQLGAKVDKLDAAKAKTVAPHGA